MTTPAASYAKQIALDVIAQMAAEGAPTWAVPMTAEYDRMYLSDLEDMAPADGPATQMQVVFAPVEPKWERTGWGGTRITITLGILFDVMVQKQNGVVTDPNIDAYEWLVDQFCTWLIGPRKFATFWSAHEPTVVLGDHYNDHLYEKSEFHVPVLVDFICDVEVSLMADPRFYGPDSLLAGKQVGTGIHKNYKMAGFVAYQRRHLSSADFNAWVASDVRVQAYLERQAHLSKPERELERIFNDIGRKCILPSLQEASDFLAAIEKGNAPSETGTLKQSIGSTKAKWYGASFCGWVASGPRRGYGRAVMIVVTPKGKIKLKRLSNKASQIIKPSKRKNPVDYAYFLEHGRKGVKPTKKKALLIAATGFVGMRASAKDAPPKDFMAPARAAGDEAANKAVKGIDERLQAQLTQ